MGVTFSAGLLLTAAALMSDETVVMSVVFGEAGALTCQDRHFNRIGWAARCWNAEPDR